MQTAALVIADVNSRQNASHRSHDEIFCVEDGSFKAYWLIGLSELFAR